MRNDEKSYTQQAVEKETSEAFSKDDNVVLSLNVNFGKRICENFNTAYSSA